MASREELRALLASMNEQDDLPAQGQIPPGGEPVESPGDAVGRSMLQGFGEGWHRMPKEAQEIARGEVQEIAATKQPRGGSGVNSWAKFRERLGNMSFEDRARRVHPLLKQYHGLAKESLPYPRIPKTTNEPVSPDAPISPPSYYRRPEHVPQGTYAQEASRMAGAKRMADIGQVQAQVRAHSLANELARPHPKTSLTPEEILNSSQYMKAILDQHNVPRETVYPTLTQDGPEARSTGVDWLRGMSPQTLKGVGAPSLPLSVLGAIGAAVPRAAYAIESEQRPVDAEGRPLSLEGMNRGLFAKGAYNVANTYAHRNPGATKEQFLQDIYASADSPTETGLTERGREEWANALPLYSPVASARGLVDAPPNAVHGAPGSRARVPFQPWWEHLVAAPRAPSPAMPKTGLGGIPNEYRWNKF